ncbi:MAG: aspartate aminotransferase family protein [Planctomycetes bacterium]|nr:aspartate aminotransferase family protein [Planctomycetota bacterium]
MKTQEIKDLFSKYVIPNYNRAPIAIVKGEGSWIWDSDGKKYLDFFPGWGVSGIGHCHPKVVEAVKKQAEKLFHIDNTYYSEEQGRFAEILSTKGNGQQCFFCNSGAEAAEGAIKLARLHCQPRYKVVTLLNSFHGRTFAAMTATGQPGKQKGLTPLVPGFSYAKINNLASVKELVDDETCAVMVEPVQGEGGVNPCTLEFLQGLRDLCDEKGICLIFDEVQTTPARLGTWFGYQHFNIQPDILTSAKAIAGGMPMGIIMAKPEVAKSLVPGMHASTFGGNSIGCAAGIATFEAIEEDGMLGNIERIGKIIDARVESLKNSTGGIKGIRRVGFMIGIELEFEGAALVQECMDNGLRVNCTQGNILRMLPAFNITEDEIATGFGIIEDAVKKSLA